MSTLGAKIDCDHNMNSFYVNSFSVYEQTAEGSCKGNSIKREALCHPSKWNYECKYKQLQQLLICFKMNPQYKTLAISN